MTTGGPKPVVVAVGELLIDLISSEVRPTLAQVARFYRYVGAGPATVAANLAKMGLSSHLVATVGNDDWGSFLLNSMKKGQVGSQYIRQESQLPTSVRVSVRSQQDTPALLYRQADAHILAEQLPFSLLQKANLLHTSIMALSAQPAQDNIIQAARMMPTGCQLSVDLNYNAAYGLNTKDATRIIEQLCRYAPLLRANLDTFEQLTGKALAPLKIIEYLHKAGARLVCLNRGTDGIYLSNDQEPGFISIPPLETMVPNEVSTLGDAWWSGFLAAWLNGASMADAGYYGRQVAGLKLNAIGPLKKESLEKLPKPGQTKTIA